MPLALLLACAAAVACAAFMLFQRSLYSSAICLLAVLLQVSAIYFILGAQMLGLVQTLVYAGAVMVLLVMMIMSVPERLGSLWADIRIPGWALAGGIILVLAQIILVARHAGMPEPIAWVAPAASIEKEMASWLFGRYALMTEAVGLVVLISALALVEERGD